MNATKARRTTSAIKKAPSHTHSWSCWNPSWCSQCLGDVEGQIAVSWSSWREWDKGASAGNQFLGQLRCSDDLLCPRAVQSGTGPALSQVYALPSIFPPEHQFSTEKEVRISQTHWTKENMTPVQRGTDRATSRECGRISGGRVWKTEMWLQREESEGELDRERWRQGSCLEERARGEKGGGKVRGTQRVQNNLHSPQRFLFKKIKKEWWRRGESQTSLMMCVQSSDWKNDREKQPVSALINCSLL